jgi:hypothetical protein
MVKHLFVSQDSHQPSIFDSSHLLQQKLTQSGMDNPEIKIFLSNYNPSE